MTVLVTGGAGFIGSALVRYLVQNTPQTVVNIDKLDYASDEASLAAVRGHSQHVFYQADICNREKLEAIFQRHRPLAVFHLAAQTHVDRSIKNPDLFINNNVMGTFQLLEAIRTYWRQLPAKEQVAFRFIHVSTDEVFGDLGLNQHPPLKEQSCYLPSSPYSASKAGSDHLVQAWHRTYELPVIITHCANNYGPYQYPEKLIPTVIYHALQGQSIPIYGRGNQIRDWIHVKDHVRALYLIWQNGRIGQSYNISAHQQMSNIELVERICDLLDAFKKKSVKNKAEQDELLQPEGAQASSTRFADLITHVADRPGHDQRYAIDATKLKEELGWRAKVAFEQGIQDTVFWYYRKYQNQNS